MFILLSLFLSDLCRVLPFPVSCPVKKKKKKSGFFCSETTQIGITYREMQSPAEEKSSASSFSRPCLLVSHNAFFLSLFLSLRWCFLSSLVLLPPHKLTCTPLSLSFYSPIRRLYLLVYTWPGLTHPHSCVPACVYLLSLYESLQALDICLKACGKRESDQKKAE